MRSTGSLQPCTLNPALLRQALLGDLHQWTRTQTNTHTQTHTPGAGRVAAALLSLTKQLMSVAEAAAAVTCVKRALRRHTNTGRQPGGWGPALLLMDKKGTG